MNETACFDQMIDALRAREARLRGLREIRQLPSASRPCDAAS